MLHHTYALYIAYSKKNSMFKKDLQQIAYFTCHEKGRILATSQWPVGQALKISSMGFLMAF